MDNRRLLDFSNCPFTTNEFGKIEFGQSLTMYEPNVGNLFLSIQAK